MLVQYIFPLDRSIRMRPYLQQPPARVEIFDALQVAGRQLDVGRTVSGRQVVHVRYVVLNRSDLLLELLEHRRTFSMNSGSFVSGCIV